MALKLLHAACYMLSRVSHRSYFLSACVGIQNVYAKRCLIEAGGAI